jgi:amino acid transporter
VSVLAIGWINYVGVSTASRVQGVLTVGKVIGLATIP